MARKKLSRESGRARTMRLARETPACECGAPAVYQIRKYGKSLRWCSPACDPR